MLEVHAGSTKLVVAYRTFQLLTLDHRNYALAVLSRTHSQVRVVRSVMELLDLVDDILLLGTQRLVQTRVLVQDMLAFLVRAFQDSERLYSLSHI